eukprot:scaffold123563_cov51-Phaeocystis_antarctica.AAC.6
MEAPARGKESKGTVKEEAQASPPADQQGHRGGAVVEGRMGKRHRPTFRPSGAASSPDGEGGPSRLKGPCSKGEPAAHGEGFGTSSYTAGDRQAADRDPLAPKVGARCSSTSAATTPGCAPPEKSNEASGTGSLSCRYSTGGRPSSFFAQAFALVVGAVLLLMSPSALRCFTGCCCCCCFGLAPLVTFPSAPRPGWV